MASSGTIWAQQVGTRPRLSIYWKAVRQDIPNNRTEIEATLRLHSTYSLNFSANKTGSLDGTAFTYTGGFSGTGQVNLSTKKFWVNHSSDGTKTQSISGSFNIAVKYSGVQLNSLSVSGNMSLERIPRGSALSSASITALKNGTSATLTIGRTVHSSAFYHLVSIHDGSTWIWDSGYIKGSPSTTHTIASSTVNTMLNRMGSVTSKSYTVSLRTYTGSGGSGQIGNVSRSMTTSVHSDVKPSVNKPSVNISGTGRDKTIGKYVQGFSKVNASVSGSAGYGSSVSSYSITVRRVGGSDSQSISGSSGTTSRAVALAGSYEVIGTVTDTRGRSNTNKTTFTVDAYSPPAITAFTAVRSESAQTTVNITRATTHSLLGGGGNNNLSYSVQRRLGTGSWTNVNTKGSGTITASPHSDTSTSTGNAVTNSYEFRYVVTDQFGGRAESVVSVTTQRVVLDIHKNEGVGIGKIHEQGILDVGGVAYFEEMGYNTIPGGADLNNYTTPGFYSNGANATVSTMTNTPNSQAFGMIVIKNAGVTQMWFQYNTRNVYIRSMYNNNWGSWGLLGGSTAWADITGKPSTFAPSSHNHSGANITSGTVPYARLPVGTGSSQVARGNHTHAYQQTARVANGQTGTINNSTWTKVSFGKTFPSTPAVVATGVSNVTGESYAKVRNRNTTGFEIIVGGTGTSNIFNWLAVVTG